MYWRALVENAVGLIRDAATLLATSAGRSRSLLVLAQEQLGQSAALYDLASAAWSSQSGDVVLSDRFVSLERRHPSKLVAAIEQDDELDSWAGPRGRISASTCAGASTAQAESACARQAADRRHRRVPSIVDSRHWTDKSRMWGTTAPTAQSPRHAHR
ncbi:AbiV family abortive infection protein [Curtobacterium flaccumfaciens]|uniref:AbiV family abortive infection protein n=1 Tax=Curtobacterium flaccumfaciens TaxID=2035 RepID=UPI0036F31D14